MKKILILAFAALLPFAVMAQMRVTGTVTASDDGTPVSFATVVVKGNNSLITSTDIDGKFTFPSIPGNAVLVVTYIGYTTIEVPVNNRAVVDIEISPDASTLEEVMVVAYGTAKKASYTGAASVVRQEAIKDMPVTSFENAMNGKVAGMMITTSSGQTGSAVDIRIRGIGSMNASNDPLYVVDGVPVISGSTGQMGGALYSTNNVMSSINPSDIESITVLKDAAASSLYGSRAANGVIVIQTKRGQSGKPHISFKAAIGITPSFATCNYDLASPQEQAELMYEMFFNATKWDGGSDAEANDDALYQLNMRFGNFGYDPNNVSTNVNTIRRWHGYSFTTTNNSAKNIKISALTDGVERRADASGNPIFFNWDDVMFRTGVYQTYDLAVSGGTDQSTYYTSISYSKDKGMSVLNDFDRITGRVNVNQKIGKVFEMMSNVSVSNTEKSGFNDTWNNSGNYFQQSRNLLWPFYWPTDYITGEYIATVAYPSYGQNFVYQGNEWDNSSKTLKVSASETMTIKFTDDLNFRTIFSFDNTNTRDHLYYSAKHLNGTGNNGVVYEYSTNYRKLVSSSTLNYNKVLADKHNIGLLVGWEAEKNDTDYLYARGINMSTPLLTTITTAGDYTASGYTWGNTMLSIFSRAEYSYNNKYYLSGSYRRDGSSRLGPNTRWGDFWSVGGAWRINNETFMEGLTAVNNLRLVASYGINGTLPNSNYGWRSLNSYSRTYLNNPAGYVSTYADANLAWETNYTTNVALEIGLFQNRINASIGYYNRDSKNLLQDVPVSLVTGFSSTLRNIGLVNNRGLEIELSGDIIRNNSIRWNVGITASTLQSTVKKLYGGQDIIWWEPVDDDAQFIYREGASTLAFYGLEYAGVKELEHNGALWGMSMWYLNDGTKPEDAPYIINGRAATDNWQDAEQVILGDANPKLFGGINTDISWKGFTLGLNFIYRLGGYTYDGFTYTNDDGYMFERPRSKYAYDNRWTPEHRDAKYPQWIAIDMEDVNQYSSRHMYEADYLRLKNITLSYDLPKTVVSKVGMSGARIYVNGTNLLTFAKQDNFDPEVGALGIRSVQMPFGKTYTFGLELNF